MKLYIPAANSDHNKMGTPLKYNETPLDCSIGVSAAIQLLCQTVEKYTSEKMWRGAWILLRDLAGVEEYPIC